MRHTYEQACGARDELVAALGDRPDILGIGIALTPTRDDYAVEVLVSSDEAATSLPSEVQGITVQRKTTGPVRGL